MAYLIDQFRNDVKKIVQITGGGRGRLMTVPVPGEFFLRGGYDYDKNETVFMIVHDDYETLTFDPNDPDDVDTVFFARFEEPNVNYVTENESEEIDTLEVAARISYVDAPGWTSPAVMEAYERGLEADFYGNDEKDIAFAKKEASRLLAKLASDIRRIEAFQRVITRSNPVSAGSVKKLNEALNESARNLAYSIEAHEPKKKN